MREPNCAQQRLPKHCNTLKTYTGSFFASEKKADQHQYANKKKVSTAGIDNAKKNTTDFNLRQEKPLCVYIKNYHTGFVQVQFWPCSGPLCGFFW